MATNLRDLCRLCAKKEDFTKDLFHADNISALKLIKDLTQIAINKDDVLPTIICLNCEEKMVSFQLFLLECYKAQDNLNNVYLGLHESLPIKQEDYFLNTSVVKSELNEPEVLRPEADTILNLEDNDGVIYDNDSFHDTCNDDGGESGDDDYLTLADIKHKKESIEILPERKNGKKKSSISANLSEENDGVKASLNIKDHLKLQCDTCKKELKNWNELRVHYAKKHKMKPVVRCHCGYEIRSKSVLYKHMTEHKTEESTDETYLKEEKKRDPNIKIRDFVKFKCFVCDEKFSSWYKLRSHTQFKHEIAPVVQCRCGVTLKSKSVLYKHVQDHRNPDMLCCDKCPRITKTVEALTKHKMRHVPKSERKFMCSTCDKIFSSKDALKSHSKSHIPVEVRKIYDCDVCDLKFTTRSSAASHKRVVHDKIKRYVCDLCGYACGTNGELRQHRAIHSDDKPYVCKTCNKPFKTHANLKTHMDTHEDTSYQCYVCSRVLNSRRTLRKHLLVHEEKCRHVCSFCQKAFKRRQTLKVHLYTHTGDKPLTCKWCDERFSYASTLRSHRLRCHPDKLAAQHVSPYPFAHQVNAQVNTHVPVSMTIQVPEGPTDYIKGDIAAITKSEAEAM